MGSKSLEICCPNLNNVYDHSFQILRMTQVRWHLFKKRKKTLKTRDNKSLVRETKINLFNLVDQSLLYLRLSAHLQLQYQLFLVRIEGKRAGECQPTETEMLPNTQSPST